MVLSWEGSKSKRLGEWIGNCPTASPNLRFWGRNEDFVSPIKKSDLRYGQRVMVKNRPDISGSDTELIEVRIVSVPAMGAIVGHRTSNGEEVRFGTGEVQEIVWTPQT